MALLGKDSTQFAGARLISGLVDCDLCTDQGHLNNHSQRGFSLVEVVLSLAICVFCVFTLLGLLTVAMTGEKKSSEKVEVTQIAGRLISERLQLPVNPANSTVGSNLVLPSLEPAASNSSSVPSPVEGTVLLDEYGAVVTSVNQAKYNLDYRILYSNPDPDYATLVLEFSWPPAAPTTVAKTYSVITAIMIPPSM